MMAVDASIYGLIQVPKFRDPLESYGQAMTIRGLVDQQGIQALQKKKLEQEFADEDSIRGLFARAGGKPVSAEEVMAVSPTRGMAYGKTLLERKKLEGEIAKTDLEVGAKAAELHRDQLANVNDPATAAQWVRAGFADPRLAPIISRSGTLEESLGRIPNEPALFQDWKRRNGLGIQKFIEMSKPNIQSRDLGGTNQTLAVDPFTGAVTVTDTATKTLTPGEVQTDERIRSEGNLNREVSREGHRVTMRGQDQPVYDSERGVYIQRPAMGGSVMARQAVSSGISASPSAAPAAGAPAAQGPAVITPVGLPPKQEKAPAGYRWSADGKNLEQIPGGPATQMGEAQVKQVVGVNNTRNAIKEYRDALATWGATDIASPDARARMGTVYNNMMLQAKEAFNLGVLNGPDYSILQAVVTDPTSLKGGITSKEAKDDQAKKLDEIMGRIGQTVANTSKQPGATPPEAPRTPQKAAPKLGQREGGYIYKGGDPSKPSSWEKAR